MSSCFHLQRTSSKLVQASHSRVKEFKGKAPSWVSSGQRNLLSFFYAYNNNNDEYLFAQERSQPSCERVCDIYTIGTWLDEWWNLFFLQSWPEFPLPPPPKVSGATGKCGWHSWRRRRKTVTLCMTFQENFKVGTWDARSAMFGLQRWFLVFVGLIDGFSVRSSVPFPVIAPHSTMFAG